MAKAHTSLRRHTYRLALGALFAALSFLIGLLAKTLQGGSPLRVTLEGLPVVLAGITLGPVVGGLVGVAADLLSCLLAGQAPLPLISVGAFALGLVPGLLSLPCRWRQELPYRFLPLLFYDGLAHLAGSVLLKSAALALFYPLPVLLLRIPIYAGIILVESYLLHLLLSSRLIRHELEVLLK